MCNQFKCVKREEGCTVCQGTATLCNPGCIACAYYKVTCAGNEK